MADKNGNLFNAEYNWGTKDNILYIEDLNAPRSVTHDIQNVLADIAMRLPDEKLSELKIMYKDSFGVWDGVSASITKDNSSGKAKIAITGLNFFSINENDFNKAIEKLKRK